MVTINNDSVPILSRTVNSLREQVQDWKRQGQKIALVPTMGALHLGHLSLVEMARENADRAIASIFVNPTQFAPNEDLATYPRQEAEDLQKLADAGCDLVFLPDAWEMYPDRFATSVKVDALSESLCGLSRPHFFGGVVTVVCKLLNQCAPDIAIFGEKDYQQLLIIRRMVKDLDLPVEILGGPIIREEDGLAMSSRNAYLSKNERKTAGTLNRQMRDLARRLRDGEPVQETLAQVKDALVSDGFHDVDYLEIRSGTDLAPYGPGALSAMELADARIFAAAFIGRTRLIDNLIVQIAE